MQESRGSAEQYVIVRGFAIGAVAFAFLFFALAPFQAGLMRLIWLVLPLLFVNALWGRTVDRARGAFRRALQSHGIRSTGSYATDVAHAKATGSFPSDVMRRYQTTQRTWSVVAGYAVAWIVTLMASALRSL